MQGLPYYEKFVASYPTVEALAAAPEQEVLRLWQGLGYYSRARNLHACAQTIVSQHNGRFPDSYKELLKLKGIGRYTAAAIASFAFGETVPVVDGNVYRVLARLFGVSTDIGQASAFKEFFSLAQELIHPERPDLFNQAIMEFGALHCTPQKPLCLYCPLQQECFAYLHGKQKELPVKKGRTKVKHRYFHYFVLHSSSGEFLLNRREDKDIWQGLYDFHLHESEALMDIDAIKDPVLQQLSGQNSIVIKESAEYQHQLSHQKLHIRFFEVQTSSGLLQQLQKLYPELERFSRKEVFTLPKPVPVNNYLQNLIF